FPHHPCTPQFVLWIVVCLSFHTPSPGGACGKFPCFLSPRRSGIACGPLSCRRLHQSTERSHLLSHCATAGKRGWKHFTLPVGGLYSPTWSGFLLSVENFFLGNTANHSPPSGL